jgi:hypothetical protein
MASARGSNILTVATVLPGRNKSRRIPAIDPSLIGGGMK